MMRRVIKLSANIGRCIRAKTEDEGWPLNCVLINEFAARANPPARGA
jgi:hypothetical protein